MKKILITGAFSYIGQSLEAWLSKRPGYSVDTIDMRDPSWKNKSFSGYDAVFHVAGIVHIKDNCQNAALYTEINRDLAYKTAAKAKRDGASQFIFMSSMSVYGLDTGVIGKDTVPAPKSAYGTSKLEAEELIGTLSSPGFVTSIVRAPMVYGKGCRGNYARLERLALKTPAFPDVKNQRSMIYISNLCEFIRLLIDNPRGGVFFPQNAYYVCTSELAALIAKVNGKKLFLFGAAKPLIRRLKKGTVAKMFGDLVYEKSLSAFDIDYRPYDLEASILDMYRR